MNRWSMNQAWSNLEEMLREAGVASYEIRSDPDAKNDNGYFLFWVRVPGKKEVSVEMPGCSLATLKDPISYKAPRVVISGNTWWWQFAVETTADFLNGVRHSSVA